MSSPIVTVLFVAGIFGLFFLDRDPQAKTSKALWIPVVWFLIAGSRPVSGWLQAGPLPWAALPAASADEYTESNPINSLIFLTLLLAGLVVLAHRGPRVTRLLKVNLPLVCFFSYCALSTVWSEYPGIAFRHWMRSFGDLVMVLAVMTEMNPGAALRRLIARTGFLLLPISVLLIKYYTNLGQVYSYLGDVMYTGVTQHKNTLGSTCMILGLGFLWRFLESYRTRSERHRERRMMAHATCFAMVGWLLWMAKSATSSSCLFMTGGLLAVITLCEFARKLAVVHLLMVLLVSLALFALFFDPTGNLLQSVGRDSTLTGRVMVWRHALSLAGNPVFGTGFESFWLGSRLQRMWAYFPGDRINQAHNGYLEVYLNLGWCGLALLAVLLGTGYRNIISALRRDRYTGAFRLAYYAAAVIYNLTEAAFRMGSFTWIFLLLAVVEVPTVAGRRAERSEPVVDHTSAFAFSAISRSQEAV